MRIKLGKHGVGTAEVVAIGVAILMVAIVLPIALNEMGAATGAVAENENISAAENWGASRETIIILMGTLVPVLAILGIAMKFL